MDVAVVKKEYADAAPTGKTGKAGTVSAAEKLIGDFSAAVVARLSKTGNTAAAKGKNALVENLNPKFEVPREAAPQRETRAQHNERPREDRSSSRAHDTYANNAPPRRDDAPVRERRKPLDDRAATANTAAHDKAPSEVREQGTKPAAQGNTDDKKTAKPLAKDTVKNPTDTAQQAALVASITVPVTTTPAVVKSGDIKDGVGKTAAKPDAAGEATPQKGAEISVNPTKKGDSDAKGVDAKTSDKGESPLDLLAKNDGRNKKSSAKKTQDTAQTKAAPTQVKTQDATLAQQQAAALSRKVGPDQNLKVTVNVEKKADKLASQPSANLAGPTLLNDTTDKSGLASAKDAAKGSTVQNTPTANLGQQNGQQGANAQSQNQSQAQAALAAAANVADARAQGAQKASDGGTSQAIKAGGTETISNANTTAATTDTQTQAQRTAAPPKLPTPPRARPQQRVSEQVSVQIAKGLNDGLDTIRIQLKPAHLGLVDVQLKMGKDGRVSVVVSADNKNTLDMLKQDSRQLQNALRDAGLQMGTGDLSFSMRNQGGQGNSPWQTDSDARAEGSKPRSTPLLEPTLDELLQTGPSSNGIISKDRVDITA